MGRGTSRSHERTTYKAPLIWAAGVFDGAGRVWLRTDEKCAIIGAVVSARNLGDRAEEFKGIVGGGRVTKDPVGDWVCDAHEQEKVLRLLLPFMRNKHKRALAKKVIVFRITQDPTRKVSNEVKELRRQLMLENDDNEK